MQQALGNDYAKGRTSMNSSKWRWPLRIVFWVVSIVVLGIIVTFLKTMPHIIGGGIYHALIWGGWMVFVFVIDWKVFRKKKEGEEILATIQRPPPKK